jgi:hypothetical protein
VTVVTPVAGLLTAAALLRAAAEPAWTRSRRPRLPGLVGATDRRTATADGPASQAAADAAVVLMIRWLAVLTVCAPPVRRPISADLLGTAVVTAVGHPSAMDRQRQTCTVGARGASSHRSLVQPGRHKPVELVCLVRLRLAW